MTMRPIDAEALEEKIENLITRFKALGRKQVAEDYNFVLTVLSTAPTIEAKPVVHAHWESNQCSNCKGFALSFDNEPYRKVILSNFCPHCGAQMDEFASDNNVGSKGIKIPVISMEDVPKIAKESD